MDRTVYRSPTGQSQNVTSADRKLEGGLVYFPATPQSGPASSTRDTVSLQAFTRPPGGEAKSSLWP